MLRAFFFSSSNPHLHDAKQGVGQIYGIVFFFNLTEFLIVEAFLQLLVKHHLKLVHIHLQVEK